MSTTYIAVTELHARPDMKKPMTITPAGKPFEAPDGYDVDDLVESGVLRKPTAEEVKAFSIDDKPVKKADKAAADKAAADKAAADKKAADDEAAAAKLV